MMRSTHLVQHALVTLLAVIVPAIALAQTHRLDVIELTTSNDLISGTDDLYTAEIDIAFELDGRPLRFRERMFTDREADRRHDETSLATSFDLEPWLDLDARGSVGVLRIGKGILGEGFQNAVHGVVGSDAVSLDYLDSGEWYPLLELEVGWSPGSRLAEWFRGSARAVSAPGYRTSIEVAVNTQWMLGRGVEVDAEVGVMGNLVQSDLVRDHIDDLLPTWSIGFSWHQIGLTWSANTYGTEQQHVALVYRVAATGAGSNRPRW